MCEKYFYKVAENRFDLNLLKLIPEEFQQHFITVIGPIAYNHIPHRVKNCITLNLYKDQLVCKNTFYELSTSEPVTISKLTSQMTGYKEEDVKEVDSFIPKFKELWLVDLSKIHSLSNIHESYTPQVLQLKTTEYTFDEVYQMLRMSGAIQDVWLG